MTTEVRLHVVPPRSTGPLALPRRVRKLAFKDLGTLRTGAVADVAVLDLRQGEFEFVDNIDGKRTGKQKLVTAAVLMNGKRVT